MESRTKGNRIFELKLLMLWIAIYTSKNFADAPNFDRTNQVINTSTRASVHTHKHTYQVHIN